MNVDSSLGSQPSHAHVEQAYANYVTDMLLESDVDESSTTTTKELKI